MPGMGIVSESGLPDISVFPHRNDLSIKRTNEWTIKQREAI